MTADFITQAELARREGVSKQQVFKWKKQGRLIQKGKYVDYKATRKLLDDTETPARSEYSKRNGGGQTPLTYKDAQTAKEVARAKLAHIEVREKEGKLVDGEKLKFVLFNLFSGIKTQLRAIPAKCAQEIAHIQISKSENINAQVEQVLRKEIDEALEELSRWKSPQ